MRAQFFLAYREDSKEGGGRLVKDLSKIRKHYLRGWFSLDVASCLPFDVIGLCTCAAALSPRAHKTMVASEDMDPLAVELHLLRRPIRTRHRTECELQLETKKGHAGPDIYDYNYHTTRRTPSLRSSDP